jgi:serine/threonine protein kinase
MGVVYRARQVSLDRLVAVKVLPRELADKERFVERFTREARAAASLAHPNVIQIHAFGLEHGTPYFAMELVEGEHLGQRLKRVGRLSSREATRLMIGVASALSCAHDLGLVHRDIKPSNIMIDHRGMVKVVDFGLAKITSGADVTRTGRFMGTPRFVSPEQARGEPVDIRSDIYALGVVLYQAMSGRHPFEAEHDFAVIHKSVTEKAECPTTIVRDMPPFLASIIMKMMEKNPEDRYQTPKLLLADLKRFRSEAARTTGYRMITGVIEPRTPAPLPRPLSPPPRVGPRQGPAGEDLLAPEPVGRADFYKLVLLLLLVGGLGAAGYALLGVGPL